MFDQNFKPKTEKELLAMEIAEAFNDMKSLGFYLSYCHRYPEEIIRRAFREVKEVRIEAIRKSRGALFNYLVKKYANEEKEQYNSGH